MASPLLATVVDLPEACSCSTEAATGFGWPAGREAPASTCTPPSATSPCTPPTASVYGRRREQGPCRLVLVVSPGPAGQPPASMVKPPAITPALETEAPLSPCRRKDPAPPRRMLL